VRRIKKGLTLAVCAAIVVGGAILMKWLLRPRPMSVLEISNSEFHRDLHDAGFDVPPSSAEPFRPLAWTRPVRSEADVADLIHTLDISPAALASGAHADLVSAQSFVHFGRPLVDSIAAFTSETTDAWILRQRVLGGDHQWHTFGIVHDKTADPQLAFYFESKAGQLDFLGHSCFVCHASGPRVLRPIRSDLVVGRATVDAFNARIAENGYVAMHFGVKEPPLDWGEPLAARSCVPCHSTDRAPLYHIHDQSIRMLVATGEMPKSHGLTPQEGAEVQAWLDAAPHGYWYWKLTPPR